MCTNAVLSLKTTSQLTIYKFRQRRIKCDEKRPACSQCVRSQKTCTGYPPPSRSEVANIAMRIAPKPMPTLMVPNILQVPISLQPHPRPVMISAAPPPQHRSMLEKEPVLPPRRAGVNRQKKSLIRRKPDSTGMLPLVQPFVAIPFSGTDGLYFHLFRARTSSELSGYFDSVFWTRTVLQECHQEAAIRHAVLALGALYKTLEQSNEALLASSPTRYHQPADQMDLLINHWQVAVKQYSEACKAAMSLDLQDQRTHRTRLMATVLLTCFDSFIGDHKQAVVQIQTGLALLDQIQTARQEQGYTLPEHTVEEELLVIFTRLAIQAKSYDLAFHFPEPYVIRLNQRPSTSPDLPESPTSSPIQQFLSPGPFRSLREARLASDKLNEKILRFVERLYIAKISKTHSPTPLPTTWRAYGVNLKQALDSWSVAYEPILQSRLRVGIDPLEKRGIAAVKMFQINAQILLFMMFGESEDQFEEFLPHFRAIVELGQEVVNDDEKRAAANLCPDPTNCRHGHRFTWNNSTPIPTYAAYHIRPSFSADLGIVPPLFVVATKCREPSVRRHAISLLRGSVRREGMWDSEMVAHIAQWIMMLEENDGQQGFSPEFYGSDDLGASLYSVPAKKIQPENMVMVKSVDFDLRARVANLRVGSRSSKISAMQDAKWRETQITW